MTCPFPLPPSLEKKMAKKRANKMDTCSPAMEKDWQARDDAHEFMRMSELSRDPGRAERAMNILQGAVDFSRKIARRAKSRSKARGGGR
jgi:hypothetical protein